MGRAPPVFFTPGTLWRTWGTRPVLHPTCFYTRHVSTPTGFCTRPFPLGMIWVEVSKTDCGRQRADRSSSGLPGDLQRLLNVAFASAEINLQRAQRRVVRLRYLRTIDLKFCVRVVDTQHEFLVTIGRRRQHKQERVPS